MKLKIVSALLLAPAAALIVFSGSSGPNSGPGVVPVSEPSELPPASPEAIAPVAES